MHSLYFPGSICMDIHCFHLISHIFIKDKNNPQGTEADNQSLGSEKYHDSENTLIKHCDVHDISQCTK